MDRATVAVLTTLALVVPLATDGGVLPTAPGGDLPVSRQALHVLVAGVWTTVVVLGRRPRPVATLAITGGLGGPVVVLTGAVVAATTGRESSVPLTDAASVLAELTGSVVHGVVGGVVAVVVLRLGRA